MEPRLSDTLFVRQKIHDGNHRSSKICFSNKNDNWLTYRAKFALKIYTGCLSKQVDCIICNKIEMRHFKRYLWVGSVYTVLQCSTGDDMFILEAKSCLMVGFLIGRGGSEVFYFEGGSAIVTSGYLSGILILRHHHRCTWFRKIKNNVLRGLCPPLHCSYEVPFSTKMSQFIELYVLNYVSQSRKLSRC